MIRRWLNVSALLSLPLFVGVIACCAAGRVLPGGCGTSWKGEEILYFVDVGGEGFVTFTFGTEFDPDKPFSYPTGRAASEHRTEAATSWPAIYVGRSHRTDVPWRSGRVEYYWVRIHQLYFLALTGTPLLLWLAAWRLRHRNRHVPI